MKIGGYVCTTKGERLARRWGIVVSTVVFLGFTALLIWQAVLDGNPMFWWGILFWVALWVLSEIEICRISYADDIQFAIEPDAVSNTYPKGQVSLEVCQILYVSLLTCHIGKRALPPDRSFYLLSSQPIADEHIEYDGVKWIPRLRKYGIVIIPQSKETDAWVTNTLKIQQVPAYPKQYDRRA